MGTQEKKPQTGSRALIPSDKHLPVRSHEIVANAMVHGDGERLSKTLPFSPQYINSWGRRHESEGNGASGKYNYLDYARGHIIHIGEADGSFERAYPIGQYIAGLMQGIFIPLLVGGLPAESEIMSRVALVLKETAEAIEAVRKAWYDDTPGHIDEKERANCVKQIVEAIVALEQLRQWIDDNTSTR